MKTVEQIIIDLENEFLFHYERRERYEKQKDEAVKKYGSNSLQYESYNGQYISEGTLILFIVGLLASITENDEVEVECCLYHKFNLEGEDNNE